MTSTTGAFTGTLNGATRLVPILGDPIAQVKAPNGVSRQLQEGGLNALCIPCHATPQDLDVVVAGLKAVRNVDGIVVTVPHKFAMARHCDALSARSAFLGAVNVMKRRADGTWYGDMADGIAFVAALRDAGCEAEGRRALLVGAGGAGSAIAHALVEAGVASLAIHDGDPARRDALVDRLAGLGLAPVTVGSADPTGFDLVCNATPMGMRPDDPLPIDVDKLTPAMFVGDVVTMPEIPRLIEEARRVGCGTQTGTGMFARVGPPMLDVILAG